MNIQTSQLPAPRRFHSRVIRPLVLVLPAMATQSGVCKEPSWHQYESTNFIANSSASEKKTLAMLENLEMFRAAVLQVANLRVPEFAPKTEVLIFRTKKEFAALEPGKNVAGYALYHDGRFLIVMRASGRKAWATQLIRHEYSHILLGYKEFPYPRWYNEGFAELMSTI